MKKVKNRTAKVIQLPAKGRPDQLEEIYQALLKLETDIEQHLNNQSESIKFKRL